MAKSIEEKIRNLLAKATDPAASEAEAETAMAMAQKLMDKHQLSEDDIKEKGEDAFRFQDYAMRETKFGYVAHPIDKYLARAIGQFCGCVAWREADANGEKTRFFGTEADVEFASYLRDAWVEHFDRAWAIYSEGKNRLRDRSAMRQSFSLGFAEQMIERLEGWNRKMGTETGTTGALVARRLDLVTAEMERRGITLRAAGKGVKNFGVDHEAAGAGAVAAKSAGVGRATSGRNTRLLAG